jgi:Acylphosphatase
VSSRNLFSDGFLIGGGVQGVGFRYFTQGVATREGVTGFVRNTPDGNMEALLKGDEERSPAWSADTHAPWQGVSPLGSTCGPTV